MPIHLSEVKADAGVFIPWRSGWALPYRFEATVDDTELPFSVRIHATVSTETGPVIDKVCFDRHGAAEPISPRRLREARLGAYLDQIAAAVAWTMRKDDGAVVYSPQNGLGTVQRTVKAPPRRSPRPQDDDFIREVARVYMEALRAPGPGHKRPREAVRSQLGPVSVATAARWIAAAVKAGYIEKEEGE